MVEILVLAFGLHVGELRLRQLQFEFADALQGHVERIEWTEWCVQHLIALRLLLPVERRCGGLHVVDLCRACGTGGGRSLGRWGQTRCG